MYETSVRNLKEGDVLAKAIVGKNGMVILNKGTKLTQSYIKRLNEYGVSSVHIEKKIEKKVEKISLSIAKPMTKDKVINQSPVRNRDFIYNAIMDRANQFTMTSVKLSSEKQARLINMLRQTLVDILAQPRTVELLLTLHDYDHYLFTHSLNVAIWSALMGMELEYNSSQMLELLLGALLFDIGMTQIPVEIVKSNGTLTKMQWETLKRHTTIGYTLMTSIEGMPHMSAMCALQHHERFDGSGYPLNLKGNSITEYAQIVAIADCYDALTSSRMHRMAYTVQEAIEFMFAAGNYFYNADLVKVFLKPITAYPLSSILTLSNGQMAVVSSYSSAIAHRPVVKIIREANGTPVHTPYELDLAKECNITIVSSTA